jgi:hypothetical protein
VSHNASDDAVSKNVQKDAPSTNATLEPNISNLDTEVSVPDWLKSSFDTNEDVIDDTKTIEAKATQAMKKTSKTSENPPKKSDAASKDTTSKDDTQSSEELWDDGMKIPDWLKSDDSK